MADPIQLRGVLGPATVNPMIAAQGERIRAALAARPAAVPPQWLTQGLPMEGRATFLPFQDTAPGSVMNQRSLALPGVLAGAVNAFTAPGRAYSGSDPSFDPQYEAANLAMNMMGGGVGASAVAPQPRGTLGMFIGPSAKTWDAVAAQKAAEMAKAGVDERIIWKETGTWKGPDGKWRQEIPDNSSGLREDGFGSLSNGALWSKGEGGLSGVLQHDNLYAAYPGTKEIDQSVSVAKGNRASGSFRDGSIVVNAPSKNDALSTTLHELQHVIQGNEGWAKGGSPDMAFRDPRMWGADGASGSDVARQMLAKKMKEMGTALSEKDYAKQAWQSDVITPEIRDSYKNYLATVKNHAGRYAVEAQQEIAKEWYRKLAGEVEARAVQQRMNLDASQRRALFPADSYDIPLDQLILRR